MMMALGAARWLTSLQPASLLEPMLLLGRTSLFVYWVHVEIAYGVVSYPLHYALPLAWSAAGFVAVLLVMHRAAGWWTGRPQTVWIPRLRSRSQKFASSKFESRADLELSFELSFEIRTSYLSSHDVVPVDDRVEHHVELAVVLPAVDRVVREHDHAALAAVALRECPPRTRGRGSRRAPTIRPLSTDASPPTNRAEHVALIGDADAEDLLALAVLHRE